MPLHIRWCGVVLHLLFPNTSLTRQTVCFQTSFPWARRVRVGVLNFNTKSLKSFSAAVFVVLFVVAYACVCLVNWSIITRKYSYPPAVLSTFRKSIAMTSITIAKVIVPNGARGEKCCFFLMLDRGTHCRWKTWYLSPCLASKLLTLRRGNIFLRQDVLCFLWNFW